MDSKSTTSVSGLELEEVDIMNTSSDMSIERLVDNTVSDIEELLTTESDQITKTITKEDEGKYVAVFYTEPKLKYYWGKVLLADDDHNKDLNISFLKQKAIGSNPMDWTWWEPPNPEIQSIDQKYVLFGPVSPTINRSVFKSPDSEAHARLLQLGEHK